MHGHTAEDEVNNIQAIITREHMAIKGDYFYSIPLLLSMYPKTKVKKIDEWHRG
jgi:hypothetical protein